LQPNESGLATGLGSIYRAGDYVRIGWLGLFVEGLIEQKFVTDQLRANSMALVF
jgi:trehalose 6-phosphate synthase/phosphatase